MNKNKKVLVRNLYFGTFIMLISNDFLLGCQRFYLSHSIIPVSFSYRTIDIARKGFSNFNNKNAGIIENRHFSSDSTEHNNKLSKYEFELKRQENRFKEIKSGTENRKLKNLESTNINRRFGLNMAVIKPVDLNNLPPFPSPMLTRPFPKVFEQKQPIQIQQSKKMAITAQNILPTTPCVIQKPTQDPQADLINTIINTHGAHINPQDLRSIIDLYATIISRPKEGITNVLKGIIDSHKSGTYSNVVAYIKSKNSDLKTYINTYARLSNAFEEDAMQAIYRVVEKIIKEKQQYLDEKLKQRGNMTKDDYMQLIIEGSHPFYPVEPNEINEILELFSTLSHRPREGIINVLNGSISSIKSGIYNNIVRYIDNNGSHLKTYRYMYTKIDKALSGNGIQIINAMLDRKMNEQQEITLPIKKHEPLTIETPPNKPVLLMLKKRIEADQDNNTDATVNGDKNHFPPKRALTIAPGTLEKERKRIDRIYALLPEYHGKSITSILSGLTRDKSVPIWNDMALAIEKIRQEALREGDETPIDLNYFQNLYAAINKNMKGYSLDKKVYQISKTEQKRLDRIYELLSQHHRKSITCALSGLTRDKSVPIWNDMAQAIEKIRQEALHEGDETPIDFKYFKKLYWSSVRSYGKK